MTTEGTRPQVLDVFTWRVDAGRTGPRCRTPGDLASWGDVEDPGWVLDRQGHPIFVVASSTR